jgi:hypothetical protein
MTVLRRGAREANGSILNGNLRRRIFAVKNSGLRRCKEDRQHSAALLRRYFTNEQCLRAIVSAVTVQTVENSAAY